MSDQFWTAVIAVSGLVLALLTAAWTVYRDLLDRHNVKVSVVKMLIWSLGPQQVFRDAWDENEECIIITATNAGRRPVTITGFHFKLANSSKHAIVLHDPKDPRSRVFDAMPKELLEGQCAREFIPARDLEGRDMEYAYVVDTVGRQWKCQLFPLRPKT